VNCCFIFLTLATFQLFGIRSQALEPIITQLLSLAEKPDTVFNKHIRDIFIYIIPMFLLSAIPTRILLGRAQVLEQARCFIFPIMQHIIFKFVLKYGLTKYEIGAE